MSYVTYTTTALVCGTFARNTADASYLLFTREAGMLYADARSVREERSRQRYALQDFSLVRVSLIKGKVGWKIGSIEIQKNYYHAACDKYARGSVVSTVRLLRRFLKGESTDTQLFEQVIDSLEALILPHSERQFVQIAIQVRLLAVLGYVDMQKIPTALHALPVAEIADYANPALLQQLDQLYAHAITASHL